MDAALLFLAIAATAALFARVDRQAALLMLPDLAWTGYAIARNAEMRYVFGALDAGCSVRKIASLGRIRQ